MASGKSSPPSSANSDKKKNSSSGPSPYEQLTPEVLFESNPQPMWIYDLESLQFLAVNNAAVDIYGYERVEFLSMTISDIHPLEEVDRLEKNVAELNNGLGLAGPWRHIKRDGSIIKVEITSHALTYSNRAAELVIAHDITHRHQIERQLRESEARFRSLFEHMASGMAVASLDGRLLDVNPSLCELLGYAKPELKALNALDLIHPDDVQRHRKLHTRLMNREIPHAWLEMRLVHKSGDFIWVRSSSAVVWGAGDTPLYLVTHLDDITDRKQADIKIKESQKTLLNILDSIDATIYVADMETHEILFMNQHMKDAFGGNFEGRICHKAFRRVDHPCEHCNNDRLLDKDGQPAGVLIWEDQNPVSGRWYLNYDRAIIWMDGRFVRLQIATDITKIKQLEEERIRTEAQLLQSQKMEAIGTLAGGIAHDFNNILSAIIGFTELSLLELDDDHPVRQNLDQVYQAGTRARDMVKQILAFSRQSEPERKPINVIPIVNEALKMLRGSLPATIEIRKELDENPGIIDADPSQLHQVIMNLCTNSSHAMREEGGTLTIRVEKADLAATAALPDADLSPGAYVKICVRDTGHGISQDNLDRIFNPYFSTKPKTEGTGLGLAVVQGIVKSHCGAITVNSREGGGTTFDIYLPRVKALAAEKSKKSNAVATGNERILLVDDEQALVEIGKQLLKRLGYQAQTRTSSVEALELFQHDPQRFDLVISDMTMPNMTGDKLAREILKIRPDMPIILCTGYSERFTEAQAGDLGIKAFIMKPLVIGDLAATIRNVLDR